MSLIYICKNAELAIERGQSRLMIIGLDRIWSCVRFLVKKRRRAFRKDSEKVDFVSHLLSFAWRSIIEWREICNWLGSLLVFHIIWGVDVLSENEMVDGSCYTVLFLLIGIHDECSQILQGLLNGEKIFEEERHIYLLQGLCDAFVCSSRSFQNNWRNRVTCSYEDMVLLSLFSLCGVSSMNSTCLLIRLYT